MMLPLSVNRDLGRFEKKLAHLSVRTAESRNSDDGAYDFGADLHELIQAVSHFLDRLMDTVWRKFSETVPGKKKPNIYFPDCDSEVAFTSRLASLQLPALEAKAPQVFSAIRDVQTGFGKKDPWLRALKKLANLKHERSLNIEKTSRGGTVIGMQQDLYIKHMSFSPDGINFQGQAFNQRTGKQEKVKVGFLKEMQEILEIANKAPLDFARDSIDRPRKLAVSVHSNDRESAD
jgi:hypothetical protein